MNTFSGKQPAEHQGNISNEPFWPDMDIAVFCKSYRIPNELDTDTIIEHLQQAMAEANIKLAEFRMKQQQEGYAELAEVPADTLNDESRLIVLYRRAVSCICKAIICRDYPTIDRREPAENQAKSGTDTEVSNLKNADQAIRTFLELTEISVELL